MSHPDTTADQLVAWFSEVATEAIPATYAAHWSGYFVPLIIWPSGRVETRGAVHEARGRPACSPREAEASLTRVALATIDRALVSTSWRAWAAK